jgi:hypothetical protein
MVTFTLPDGLRVVARRYQKLIYNLLFRTSAAALQQLASDPRFVGGQIGMVGVLQTWTRELHYHPHVHYLVPAGGLASDRQNWLPARNAFLVHVKPLSVLFRAKFRDALKKTDVFDQVPSETWTQPWVVHCQPVGSGLTALKYLAPYIFRVAISHNRIIKLEDDQVTFRYKASDTGKTMYCTVTAEEFIRRFLQHVLPKGFTKVRYYGFFSPGNRSLLEKVRQLLAATDTVQPTDAPPTPAEPTEPTEPAPPEPTVCCPKCHKPMHILETIKPARCRPP